jgi:hypothetical protein
MPNDQPLLGEVEQLVLLAVLRLGSEGYAVPIRDLIKEEAGIELSDPQAVRGGKARRIFRLKPAGLAAVRASKRAVDRVSAGAILAQPAKGLA